MVRTLQPAAWMAIILISCTGFAGIAWQNIPSISPAQHQQNDTLPEKERIKEDKTVINGNLDKAIDDVHRAQENLEKQLQHKEWEKMHRDLKESLGKINAENIHEQIEKSHERY